MDYSSEWIGRAEALRLSAITILDELASKAVDLELVKPPDQFLAARDKLKSNTYFILVCGEINSGKSTLVNALIGRDLLPTGVEVTTSQIFRISHAEQVACRLRLEDNSTRPIPESDLTAYGSQVTADHGDRPRLDQMIRYIEVDVPIKFLPPGLSLLDTPGLGGLRPEHAQIVHQFMAQADAVIFVLESTAVIGTIHTKLINRVLNVTSDIFFIQTKIDIRDRDQWQEMRKRNEEILLHYYGEKLKAPNVWPISSRNLREAGKEENGPEERKALLEESKFPEMQNALKDFLFRVAGWQRTAHALAFAESYHVSLESTLTDRMAFLQETSKQKQATRLELKNSKQKQFETGWGTERARLLREIDRIIEMAKRNFDQSLMDNGELRTFINDLIEPITSLDNAEQIAESLDDDVLRAATSKWDNVCKVAQQQCAGVLLSFQVSAESILEVNTEPTAGPLARYRRRPTMRMPWWDKIRSSYLYTLAASGIGGAGAVLVPGAAPFVTAGVVVVFVIGFQQAGKAELQQAKNRLRQRGVDLLQQIRVYYRNVNTTELGEDSCAFVESRVNEHFTALRNSVIEAIDRIREQKSEEAKVEIKELQKLMALPVDEREEQSKKQQVGLDDWEEIGERIRSAVKELGSLRQPSEEDPIEEPGSIKK